MRLLTLTLALLGLLLSATARGHEAIPDISPESLHSNGFEGLILDVRSAEEFAEGHVPGALNVPHSEIASHLATLWDSSRRGALAAWRSRGASEAS